MVSMEAYNIIDTTLIDKIADRVAAEENLDAGELLKFRADLVFFVNFLQSQLVKELADANELDVVKYKDFIREDYTFKDIVGRRLNSAKKGLDVLKQLQ
jgi:site-specific recombinase XerD